jgi:hypothetical protein
VIPAALMVIVHVKSLSTVLAKNILEKINMSVEALISSEGVARSVSEAVTVTRAESKLI